MSRAARALAIFVLASACVAPAVETTSAVEERPGASDPERAVALLFRSLSTGDFETAADLTVPGQMIVVAVVEGSSVATANALIEAGATQVGARFWQSFADSLTGFLGYPPEDVRLGEVTPFSVGGEDFAVVEATVPLETGVRRIIVKRGDGWHIDVIASFAPALVPKLAPAGELLRADPAGSDLMAILALQKPSLEMVLADPNLSAQMQQAVFQAIEVINR